MLRYISEEQDKNASGIIYCLSRDDCEDLAEWLTLQGISADYYHAGAYLSVYTYMINRQNRTGQFTLGRNTLSFPLSLPFASIRLAGMPPAQKVLVQNSWQRGGTRIVVATIAYGMGVDAPHVRFVVHFTVAKSVEGYYQVWA